MYDMYNNGSKTMAILGGQYPTKLITPEIFQQLQEIYEANLIGRGNDVTMLMTDVYMWGYVNGVHGERARRAGKKRTHK